MSNYSMIVKAVASMEGKKKQVSVGNVREVLAILKKLCKDPAYMGIIAKYLSGVK